MNLTLEQRLRTGHVKRWQIVRVAREQTIAEHMYRVHTIALDIARKVGLSIPDTQMVERWALIHDLPEVVTGDIATPTKRAMRKAVPDQDPVKHIELSLDPEYRDTYTQLKLKAAVVLDVVKLADLLEAINFLMVEGIGCHAEEVEMGLRVAFSEKLAECRGRYPRYHWSFLDDIYTSICVKRRGFSPAPSYPVTV